MLTYEQLLVMCDLQYTMQEKALGTTWYLDDTIPYEIAISEEVIEALGHLGYHWWKPSKVDLEQAKLELVDAWHFYLCHCMRDVANKFREASKDRIVKLAAKELAENIRSIKLSGHALKLLNVPLFLGDERANPAALSKIYNLARNPRTIEYYFDSHIILQFKVQEFFLMYIGKNCLNRFRKANGYKEGTYNKIWNGKEDNVYLERILISAKDLEVPSDKLYNYVYDSLTNNYPG